MLLSYSEMLTLKSEVEKALIGSQLVRVEQVEKAEWLLFFKSSHAKEEKKLLVSARYPFNRFHLSNHDYSSFPSSFAAKLITFLKGAVLNKVELIAEDRILGLNFGSHRLIVDLIRRYPTVVLTDLQGKVLFSLFPYQLENYHPPEKTKVHTSIPTPCSSIEIEKRFLQLEGQAKLKAVLDQVISQVDRKLQKVIARIEHHHQELEIARQWPKKEKEAQLLQSHYPSLRRGMREIEVEDWEEGKKLVLPLDPAISPEQQLKKAFKEVRKLKKRLSICQELIDALEKEKRELFALKGELILIDHKEQLEAFLLKYPVLAPPSQVIKKESAPRSPFRTFRSATGFLIYVGKKDSDNDQLSFSIGKGNDLWFHASNFPGSHVVVPLKKGGDVDESTILDAMYLALYFSKAKTHSIEDVVCTQCKFLMKPKNAPPGKVQISQHKVVRVTINKQRLQRLLSQQNPKVDDS